MDHIGDSYCSSRISFFVGFMRTNNEVEETHVRYYILVVIMYSRVARGNLYTLYSFVIVYHVIYVIAVRSSKVTVTKFSHCAPVCHALYDPLPVPSSTMRVIGLTGNFVEGE